MALGIAGYLLLRDHEAVDSAQSQAATSVSRSDTSTSASNDLLARTSVMTTVQVVNIIDGATLDVRYDDGRVERVKLAGVDAPALDQPYGKMSRQSLQHVLERQTVGLLPRSSPVQGARHVAVILNGGDLAAMLLEQGNVTLAPDSTPDSSLKPHEAVAREARRGIWGLPPAQQIPRCAWDGTC
jgi:micrococcal nuclease